VDDQESRGPARRPHDDQIGEASPRTTEDDYSWGGKPGEDFGPLGPADEVSSPRSRPPAPLRESEIDPVWAATHRTSTVDRGRTASRSPLRPGGDFAERASPNRWRPLLLTIGIVLVAGSLVGAGLFVAARQGLLDRVPYLNGLLGPSVSIGPAPTVPPTSVPAAPAAKPAGVVPSPIVPGQSPAASPTPLTIGAPTPAPTPTRVAAASPAPRQSPAVLPTPPALVTPPGLRFPTSTPARLTTPQLFRTPPPIPSPRLPTITTRVWSEQVIHRVGDDASICGQSGSGSSAQLLVIAPDRTPRTLGEFGLPADKVCYSLKVDQPELWVLTLIIRDANTNEIDRQSAALWVSR
jgi:hypothetical protein